MKINKKHTKTIFIILVLIIFVIIIIFLPIPFPIEKNQEVYNYCPIEGTEYINKDIVINNKKFFIYTLLSDDTSVINGGDEYIITVGKITGAFKNEYKINSFSPQEDKYILTEKYNNVGVFPELSVKLGKGKYANLYIGTVPRHCKSVEINGKRAVLVKQKFDLNGKKADFYFYYCPLEEDNYDFEPAKVICENKNGDKYQIIYVESECDTKTIPLK